MKFKEIINESDSLDIFTKLIPEEQKKELIKAFQNPNINIFREFRIIKNSAILTKIWELNKKLKFEDFCSKAERFIMWLDEDLVRTDKEKKEIERLLSL